MCAASVPTVEVNTHIVEKENKTLFSIDWIFHKEFLDTLAIYDTDKNGNFEDGEVEELKKSLVDYIKQFNYLTQIEYAQKEKKFYANDDFKIQPFEDKLYFKDKIMIYNFKFAANFELKKDHKIFIAFYDKNGNFNFNIKDTFVKDFDSFKSYEPKKDTVIIRFYKKTPLENDTIVQKNTKNQTLLKHSIEKLPANQEQSDSIIGYLSKNLEIVKNKIKFLLKDIKENSSLVSYLWLLGFSFIYGIIHAIGPGHGKTLVGTYFLNRNGSYVKAFNIALLIGLVHTFSAFILTLIIYNFIGFILNDTLVQAEKFTTKISAVLIIMIGAYLLYKKLYPKNESNFKFQKAKNPSFVKTNYLQNNIHSQNLACGCNACKTQSNDLAVVLAAGIVPCPGTVTIFIFTFGLGIYFVGFLSAIFMSTGMGLIIFITAILSSKVRKKSSPNRSLLKFLEYGSLIFILFLGFLLLVI